MSMFKRCTVLTDVPTAVTASATGGCESCEYYELESDGDYGQYRWSVCQKRPTMGNLLSFPFKKAMPCFRLAFWHSEFAAEVNDSNESYTQAVAKWKAKYPGGRP
jgi:hypothetical protein